MPTAGATYQPRTKKIKPAKRKKVKRDLTPLQKPLQNLMDDWSKCELCDQKIINMEQSECCGYFYCANCQKCLNQCQECQSSPVEYFPDKSRVKELLKQSGQIALIMNPMEELNVPECDQCKKKTFPIFRSFPCNHFFCLEHAQYQQGLPEDGTQPACKAEGCQKPIDSITIDREQWTDPNINPESKILWSDIDFKDRQ